MSWDKAATALADVVSKKIDGNIDIKVIFVTVIIFGILYSLRKMDALVTLKIDLKTLFQLVAICFLFFIAVNLYFS